MSGLLGGTARWIGVVNLVLITAASLLALRNAPPRRRALRAAVPAFLVVSLIMIVLNITQGGPQGAAPASIWLCALLLLTVIVLVRQILTRPDVTLQSIYGAISAYLLLGFMFAAGYSALYYLNHDEFFAGGQHAGPSIFQYFSFTTLTTLGYGDYTPGTTGGRSIAMIEAMTGQIFLATLVAKLVAATRQRPRQSPDSARGPEDR